MFWPGRRTQRPKVHGYRRWLGIAAGWRDPANAPSLGLPAHGSTGRAAARDVLPKRLRARRFQMMSAEAALPHPATASLHAAPPPHPCGVRCPRSV